MPFLLLLAIVDDALGLVILAVFYPSGPLRPLEAVVMVGGGMAIAWLLRRGGVRSFWPYVLGAGLVSWIGLLRGGLHPALALVPIVPFMPHAARDLGTFDERKDLQHDTLSEFEHWWKGPVQVDPARLRAGERGRPAASVGPATWAVVIAMMVGKAARASAWRRRSADCGLELADGISWRDIVVIGTVSGIGFTVALFFATAASAGPLLDQAKMGALLSFTAGLAAAGLAAVLRVGRFARAANA